MTGLFLAFALTVGAARGGPPPCPVNPPSGVAYVWTVSLELGPERVGDEIRYGRMTFFASLDLSEVLTKMTERWPAGATLRGIYRDEYQIGTVEWDE